MAKDWFPSWMKNSEDKEEDKEKNKLPPELEEKFKTVDEVKGEVTKINARLASLDSISAYFEDIKKERDETKAAEAAAAARKAKGEEKSPEDLAAELLSDPKKVIQESTNDLAQAVMQVRADSIRRQVFEDRSSEFEYYSGDIKKEVDTLIASQNLKFQNDPKALENAYHTVVGRKMKEINEGKIKSRFASSSSSSLNKGTEKKEDLEFELTPEMLKAAKLTGMSPEDYKALVKRAAIAGEFEVV